MKVMCIKKGEWNETIDGLPVKTYGPSYGEICTAFDYDAIFYRILEYPSHDPKYTDVFLKDHFIPLSDIDELEIHKQKLIPCQSKH